MHTEPHSINTAIAAPRFAIGENVARILERTLPAMGETQPVEVCSREAHQIAAMQAAKMVAHQYTREAKKQCKRACLAHLIASLAPAGGVQA